MSTTNPTTEPAPAAQPTMFTEQQVAAALNHAADDILDAADAGDEGLRDGLNLLVNAAQAVPEHGEVTISTRLVQGSVVVSISDTGSGIPEDQLSRIFDPFFTTKSVGEGTGLGLSISYGIIERHGGTISVESLFGTGTTFTVRIPIRETETEWAFN